MSLTRLALLALAAAAGWGFAAGEASAQNEQFIPRLVYRTGPYAPNGIPFADGYADYIDMVNARDERLKNKGPTGASLVDPLSTGITYALIERATADKIPVVSMGYGRADASYGAVFPYVFTLPATYWAQADALIKSRNTATPSRNTPSRRPASIRRRRGCKSASSGRTGCSCGAGA